MWPTPTVSSPNVRTSWTDLHIVASFALHLVGHRTNCVQGVARLAAVRVVALDVGPVLRQQAQNQKRRACQRAEENAFVALNTPPRACPMLRDARTLALQYQHLCGFLSRSLPGPSRHAAAVRQERGETTAGASRAIGSVQRAA
jgi:hypothetical protein